MSEIQRVLEREGHEAPSRNTIWVWTHPRQASKQSARDVVTTRAWRVARASFAWPGVRTDTWKRGRMTALRRAGLSFTDIARVMALDSPQDPPLSGERVRDLTEDVAPSCAGCGGPIVSRGGRDVRGSTATIAGRRWSLRELVDAAAAAYGAKLGAATL